MIEIKDLSDDLLVSVIGNKEEQEQYRKSVSNAFEATVELYKRLEQRVKKLEDKQNGN